VANNNVAVLLGNGDGTFLPTTHRSVGANPGNFRLGDFNGDGILDLAGLRLRLPPGLHSSLPIAVTVLTGQRHGTFGRHGA